MACEKKETSDKNKARNDVGVKHREKKGKKREKQGTPNFEKGSRQGAGDKGSSVFTNGGVGSEKKGTENAKWRRQPKKTKKNKWAAEFAWRAGKGG